MPKQSKQSKPPARKARGGARPNAGRPRVRPIVALISQTLAADLEKLALEDLIPAITDLVRGVHVMQVDKHGETRVYTQPPNAQMTMYVMDRILGKMPNRTEVSGGTDADGNTQPIPIELLPPLPD